MGLFPLAALWLGLIQYCAVVKGAPRDLLGAVVKLNSQELGFFGLSGEELLLESSTACEEPLTIGQRASLGLVCGWAGRARSCLSYSDTQPVWGARDCTGQRCLAKNNYDETLCLLGNYGVDIDVTNTSRSSTCGLDAADKDWLAPKINPVAQKSDGEPSCTVVVPKGVDSYIWADCVDGKPELRYELRFSHTFNMGKRPYNCDVSPTCNKQNIFRSMLVCYIKGDNFPPPESEDEGDLEELENTTESASYHRYCCWTKMFWLSFLTMWVNVYRILCHWS